MNDDGDVIIIHELVRVSRFLINLLHPYRVVKIRTTSFREVRKIYKLKCLQFGPGYDNVHDCTNNATFGQEYGPKLA